MFCTLFWLRFTPNLKWGTYPSLKMQVSWSAPRNAFQNTRFSCYALNLQESDLTKKWSNAVMSLMGQPNPHFPAMIEFKSIYAILLGNDIFYRKCSDDPRSLILLVQTFTSRTRYARSTELNHTYFFLISFLQETAFRKGSRGSFREYYRFSLFKSSISCHLASFST